MEASQGFCKDSTGYGAVPAQSDPAPDISSANWKFGGPPREQYDSILVNWVNMVSTGEGRLLGFEV